MSITDIENVLRKAPQPKPPGNLEHQLKAQALNARMPAPQQSLGGRTTGSWFSRWRPALSPAGVSLACAASLTVQNKEIRTLKAAFESSNQGVLAPDGTTPASVKLIRPSGEAAESSASGDYELARLRQLASSLTAEISKLEKMRAENDQLRAQLASRSAAVFTPEETKVMEDARERVGRIQCINNMKQIGLAMHMWAIDHGKMTPPNIIAMTNELSSFFKVLICPADTGRQPADSPPSFTMANCSYEYLGRRPMKVKVTGLRSAALFMEMFAWPTAACRAKSPKSIPTGSYSRMGNMCSEDQSRTRTQTIHPAAAKASNHCVLSVSA